MLIINKIECEVHGHPSIISAVSLSIKCFLKQLPSHTQLQKEKLNVSLGKKYVRKCRDPSKYITYFLRPQSTGDLASHLQMFP